MKDERNPLSKISLRSGMKKEEVNTLLNDIVILLDDVFKGKRHCHNWICKCGKRMEKKWGTMTQSVNGYCCEDCQRENRKIDRLKRKENAPHKHNPENEIVACVQCGRVRLKKQTTKGLCDKHYGQLMVYGYFLDNNPRTRLDPNEIVLRDNFAEIILYDNKNEECARAIVDIEDVDIVKQYKWNIQKGYVTTKSTGQTLSLHRVVMGIANKEVFIDHINHNTLDNRKDNLRIVDNSKNGMNKSVQSNNISGFSGVYYNKRNGLWCVEIKKDNITIPIGSSKDYTEAIEMRIRVENELFGSNSLNNSVDIYSIVPTVGMIYMVKHDMRLNCGVVVEILNEYTVLMYPIKNNILIKEKVNVDIRRLRYAEIINAIEDE